MSLFDFLRKKKPFDDAAKSHFVEALATILEIQKACAGSHPIEDPRGKINHKALGYIYGFVDSALTAIGQDMSNAAIGVPITYQVLRRLFPGHEERYTQFLVETMGKDEEVTLGATKGGQQYIDFVAKQRSDGGVAMGLARYLIEGDKEASQEPSG